MNRNSDARDTIVWLMHGDLPSRDRQILEKDSRTGRQPLTSALTSLVIIHFKQFLCKASNCGRNIHKTNHRHIIKYIIMKVY